MILIIVLLLQTVVSQKQKGVNFLNGQWSPPKYNSQDARNSFSNLAESNTDYIALTFCWYQWDIYSTDIYPRSGISPTDDEISSITNLAHSAGSKVMIRPLVDPDWSNPQTKGTWRGMIGLNFTSALWDDWFKSYSDYILHFAQLATNLKADEFSVGGELITVSKNTNHWRTLISAVRNIYKGPILYGANHGNENQIDWWDAVDFIGVDAYYNILPSNPRPSLQELITAWNPIKSGLQSLSLKWNRGVIFSEIGFCSKTGANMNPAACDGNQVNMTAQEALYQSVYQSFWDETWFQGIFWWDWASNPNDGGTNDGGFSPHGKPAEQVMRNWNQK